MACEDNKINPIYVMVHGDDTDLELKTADEAAQIMSWLTKNLFEITPSKTLLSNYISPKTEFLKTYTDRNSICGYSSRLVTSIVYNKPW